MRPPVDSLLAGLPAQICIFCVGSLCGRPRIVPRPVLVKYFFIRHLELWKSAMGSMQISEGWKRELIFQRVIGTQKVLLRCIQHLGYKSPIGIGWGGG